MKALWVFYFAAYLTHPAFFKGSFFYITAFTFMIGMTAIDS